MFDYTSSGRSPISRDGRPNFDPLDEVFLGEHAGRECLDRVRSLVLVPIGMLERQSGTFELDEHAEVACALVAVGSW